MPGGDEGAVAGPGVVDEEYDRPGPTVTYSVSRVTCPIDAIKVEQLIRKVYGTQLIGQSYGTADRAGLRNAPIFILLPQRLAYRRC